MAGKRLNLIGKKVRKRAKGKGSKGKGRSTKMHPMPGWGTKPKAPHKNKAR